MMKQILTAVLCVGGLAAQGGFTWQINPANGHSYAMTQTMPWAQAEALAVQLGGHLATVRDAGEEAWLIQTFGTGVPEDSRFWIGLSDEAVEGAWVWSSGDSSTYANWGVFEPDNAGGAQDYAALWLIPGSYGGGWGWSDDYDWASWPAILEVEPPATPGAAVVYGAGCGSPVLTMQAQAGSVPIIGQVFRADIGNASLGFAAVVVGTSDQAWVGMPLPVALDPFGFEGCTLYQSADLSLVEPATAVGVSAASYSLAVPSNFSLIGGGLFLQAWSVQLAFNSAGIVLSNGVAVTIGSY